MLKFMTEFSSFSTTYFFVKEINYKNFNAIFNYSIVILLIM